MPQSNKCAKNSTKIKSAVLKVAQTHYFCAIPSSIWHKTLGLYIVPHLAQADFPNENSAYYIIMFNAMIHKQYLFCNPRCEVCEIKNHITVHSNTQQTPCNYAIQNRKFSFLKTDVVFFALNSRQIFTKTLGNHLEE